MQPSFPPPSMLLHSRSCRLFIRLFLPVSKRSAAGAQGATVDPRNERFVCRSDTTLKVDSQPPPLDSDRKSFVACASREQKKRTAKPCLRAYLPVRAAPRRAKCKIRELEREETCIFRARLAHPRGAAGRGNRKLPFLGGGREGNRSGPRLAKIVSG